MAYVMQLASCQQTCMTYTIAVCTVKFCPDPARKLSANPYDIYHCCLYNGKTPDRQRKCLKHAEFYYKNKFEKLVHLVGFIIRILLVLQDQCQVVPLHSPSCSSLCTVFLPFICVWHLLKYEVTQHI